MEKYERLLDLLMAAILFVESKNSKPNPFVRAFNDQNEEAAYKLFVRTLEYAKDAHMHEVEALNEQRMSEIEDEEQDNLILEEA